MKMTRKRSFIHRDERPFRGTTLILRLRMETVDLSLQYPQNGSLAIVFHPPHHSDFVITSLNFAVPPKSGYQLE
jgi:hypothetical protein